jgi:uncharacterized protein YfaT (DUF1175 family)
MTDTFNSPAFVNAVALARQLGKECSYHEASSTWQIEGSRWDRWLVLRNYPDSNCVPNSSNTYIRGMYA